MLIIQANKQKKRFLTSQKPFVPQVGIEPTTYGFSERIIQPDIDCVAIFYNYIITLKHHKINNLILFCIVLF